MPSEKDKSFYYCTNCEQHSSTLANGVCPLCNSQAVVTVGWEQVPTQERTDWFERIHGGRRSTTARTGVLRSSTQPTNKQ